MSKYREDSYLIVLFNEYGTKMETRESSVSGLIATQEEGRRILQDEGFASFAVLRVLYNTIDESKRERWK
jgi:hypothetical protein